MFLRRNLRVVLPPQLLSWAVLLMECFLHTVLLPRWFPDPFYSKSNFRDSFSPAMFPDGLFTPSMVFTHCFTPMTTSKFTPTMFPQRPFYSCDAFHVLNPRDNFWGSFYTRDVFLGLLLPQCSRGSFYSHNDFWGSIDSRGDFQGFLLARITKILLW